MKIKNVIYLILIIVFLHSCINKTGISQNPQKKKLNSSKPSIDYSINDVNINIINLNKASDIEIKSFNNPNVEEINYEVKKFSKIYDYNYQYILGPADTISINLTDTDDLDGSYLIDQDGMIDLPFIGKLKIDNLNLNDAQNILTEVIKNYYKNPDLQINIEEFNSSKVYILGAVRNQVTIKLDQKPIRLIEAAIQASNQALQKNHLGQKVFLEEIMRFTK